MVSTLESQDQGYIFRLSSGVGVRAMRKSDNIALAAHMNNQNILMMLRDRIPNPYTEADAAQWIEYNLDPEQHVRSGKWTSKDIGSEGPAIPQNYVIAIDDEAVGGIGLDFGSDVYFRTAELGYWLSEKYWRKGIMSEVASTFVQWAWENFEVLIRLNAESNEKNTGSRKVLVKAGFELEGRRPNMICKNGEISGAIIWGAQRPT